jgi:formylglycine-generating enzyme required for sulfatase activity
LAERRTHAPRILQLYRDEPDPGIHGAAEWLLRQWQRLDEMKEIDQGLMTGKLEGKRQWYINRQGLTMMVIPKPGEFWMGEGDKRCRAQINWSFALASKKVTVEQFRRFREGHVYSDEYAHTLDCPVNTVSWYDAAAYCNWLSEQEGIPKEQWCYELNKEGKYGDGMMMATNFLMRTGYRLPTEAEWEYACRAGSDTNFSFGELADPLVKYAWFLPNSLGTTHPVGLLRSNDLGLFDMNGNVWEWCQDEYREEAMVIESEANTTVKGKATRVLRGGTFNIPAQNMHSAYRWKDLPTPRTYLICFRPARTLLLSSDTALPPAPEGGRK